MNFVCLHKQRTGESGSIGLKILKKLLTAPLKKTSETSNALLAFIVMKTVKTGTILYSKKNPAPLKFARMVFSRVHFSPYHPRLIKLESDLFVFTTVEQYQNKLPKAVPLHYNETPHFLNEN